VTADSHDVLGPVLGPAVEQLVAELLAEREELAADRWPEYMDVPTAAAYSSQSVKRVRNLLAAGVLPRIQDAPGHRVLVARADLDTLMRSWRVEGVTPRR
jgi:hypothetical protein